LAAPLWEAIEAVVSRADLRAALAVVSETAPPPGAGDPDDWRAELLGRYQTVTGFLKLLPAVISFGATAEGTPVSATFTMVQDSTVVNAVGGAGGVEVERQHAPGARAGVIDRHGARLAGRLGGQSAGMPGRVSAAAIARYPDMRSTRNRRRDRMPSGLGGGAREAVRTARARCRDTRRVARRQC
jgi:hypothetical protein